MAAREDVAGAESLLLEGAAIEDEEGDGGENCYEFLDEIKERYGDPASIDPSVLLVEGASDSSPETLKRRGVASGWRPEDDALLAAGVGTFPTGEDHRWRSIAEMVPGKSAAQCQSRARDEDFIQAHRHTGGKKSQLSSVLSSAGAVYMLQTSGLY